MRNDGRGQESGRKKMDYGVATLQNLPYLGAGIVRLTPVAERLSQGMVMLPGSFTRYFA